MSLYHKVGEQWKYGIQETHIIMDITWEDLKSITYREWITTL